MKSFKLIKENNEIRNKLSNKHIKMKNIILDNLTYENISDLIQTLDISIKSLKTDGKNTLQNLQSFDEKVQFMLENNDIINDVLNETDLFNTPLNRLNINNIEVFISKAIDLAILKVMELIKTELTS
jgi:ArsR family metal-binding transcriptional regulator